MLIGDTAQGIRFPYPGAEQHRYVEHEASTSKIGEDQLFYFSQRAFPQKMQFP